MVVAERKETPSYVVGFRLLVHVGVYNLSHNRVRLDRAYIFQAFGSV